MEAVYTRRWRAQNPGDAKGYMKIYMRYWRARERLKDLIAKKDLIRLDRPEARAAVEVSIVTVRKRMELAWKEKNVYVKARQAERRKKRQDSAYDP